MKALFWLLLILGINLNTYAQAGAQANETAQQDGKQQKFETITVTATKNPQETFVLPMSVVVVNTSEPQYATVQQTADLFRSTNGVEFTGGPARNAQEPRMRGYGSENIIMLLDGTRQNFNSGHSGRIFIEPELIKQIEVLRGSASSLYGNGGLGGVISFETKKASDLLKKGQKVGAMQKNTYASGNDEFMNSTSVYGKSGKMDVVSNITYRNSGDIKLGDGTKMTNADNLIWSGLFNANYAASPYSTVTASFNGSNNRSQELNAPQTNSTDSDAFATDKTIKTYTAKLGYKYKPMNDIVDFSASIYNTKTDIGYIARQKTQTIAIGQTRMRSLNTLGFDVQNVSLFKSIGGAYQNRVTYGLNYFRDQQESANTNGSNWAVAPIGSNENLGGYIESESTVNTKIGKFLLTPSARYDMFQTSNNDSASYFNSTNQGVKGNAFSPKLAFSYQPKDWVMLYTNYAYGFRSPNATERFADGEHYRVGAWTNNFLPNQNLKPETNRTLEGGFGFDFKDKIQKNDRLTFKSSFYRTEAFNFINQTQDVSGLMQKAGTGLGCGPLAGPPHFNPSAINPYNPLCNGASGYTTYQNTARALIQGFDVNADYKSNNLNLYANYSMVSAKDANTNTVLYTAQPRSLKLGGHYAFGDILGLGGLFASTKSSQSSFIVGYRVNFVDSFNYNTTNDVNELKSSFNTSRRTGYTVQDAYIQYNIGKDLSLNLAVDNFTNKAYRRVNTLNYDMGRSYRVGFTLKI